jgi:uncharacterized membrane protein
MPVSLFAILGVAISVLGTAFTVNQLAGVPLAGLFTCLAYCWKQADFI